ncbi:hypothetical protein KUG47_12125 [Falsochrobactrum sp. TDYN1]|uniref:Uncharacterized protein n=1 Tax=Falsochrobactrum tianjinense TaxID=2706015 RepID=A0A949UVF6_9HYPH|nr:hypothetical protein [Falsochrobactrum sp. TDYN1]MBV2144241.1 hypothetical protein [Falsochrobactrum sp. TDYN1]
MSLLDTDALKNIMSAAFAPIFGTGQLIRTSMVRQPGGVILPVEEPPVDISVQVDRADEAMRQSAGYTDTDVKLIILQAGIAGKEPDTDSIVVAQGRRWKVSGVRSDPARSHWIMRGIRQATEE